MTEIIVTIGPSSLSAAKLLSLQKAGASSFRINLSHSDTHSLHSYFSAIMDSGVMPSIDTQGAQLRVEVLPKNPDFQTGQKVSLVFGNESDTRDFADLTQITFNHPEASGQVEVGDLLKIDFNGLIVKLVERSCQYSWIGEVVASGKVFLNRAVDITGKSLHLAPLTIFDQQSIEFAQRQGCREVYASFVSSGDDVALIRKTLAKDTRLISKIESASGVANALEIIEGSDAILIDRGDLSREISIPSVPIAVRSIVDLAVSRSCPVFIATNVLDSMMSSHLPSRAEISDIYTLLASGVSGLVLAAEVAIGKNPVASAALLEYLSRLYNNHRLGLHGVGLVQKPDRSLVGDQLFNWL